MNIKDLQDGIPFPNIYPGVSIEDQQTADERIPLLLQTPAAKRFVSYEPAIGPVDFARIQATPSDSYGGGLMYDLTRNICFEPGDVKGYRIEGLDWLIMGGESGPGARPMHPDWARSVRDQCKAAGVAFFFKQWGEWASIESDEDDFILKGSDAVIHLDGSFETGKQLMVDLNKNDVLMRRVGKKAAGCLLDGKEHKELLR